MGITERIFGILVAITLLIPGISLNAVVLASTDVNFHQQMNRIAQEFIVLAFSLSKSDKDYVDAYFGPPELKQKGLEKNLSLAEIGDSAAELSRYLESLETLELTPESRQRHRFLFRLIRAMQTRIKMLQGEKLSFDLESEGLYNVTLPRMNLAEFQKIRKELDALVPGDGDLEKRLGLLRKNFLIPEDKIEAIFRETLDEARNRTRKFLPLRQDEKFNVELVKGYSWAAYNWFQGNGTSLIQLNCDSPLTIPQMIGLACHEGYPGHHVFHSFMEKVLYREKGWTEFSIYPLFSPMSVISEGLANFGVDLAFPDPDRLKFETEVLCPRAGIDPKNLETYHRILRIAGKLVSARNLIARDFLDGTISEEEAVHKIQEMLLRSPDSARQSIAFIKNYRSYLLTYTIGEILVREYLSRKAGENNPEQQWKEYLDLMTRPVLPEDLKGNQE